MRTFFFFFIEIVLDGPDGRRSRSQGMELRVYFVVKETLRKDLRGGSFNTKRTSDKGREEVPLRIL